MQLTYSNEQLIYDVLIALFVRLIIAMLAFFFIA